jgi:nicotinamidase-related amidase
MDEGSRDFGRFTREDLEEIAGHRMGATPRVGFGEQCALLVIDMTQDVVNRHADCAEAADNIVPLLAAARRAVIPIIFTHGGGHLHSESFAPLTEAERGYYPTKVAHEYKGNTLQEKDFAIAAQITPQPGEAVITKHRSSAFLGTFLQPMLTWHRVDTLIVTGMSTTGCVQAVVRDAFSYNYRVIIPEGCTYGGATRAQHYLTLLHMDRGHGDVMPLAAVVDHLDAITVADTTHPPGRADNGQRAGANGVSARKQVTTG